VLESEYEQRAAAMRAEYEKKLADLQSNYAHVVARRLAETLLQVAEGRSVGDVIATALSAPAPAAVPASTVAPPAPSARIETPAPVPASAAAPTTSPTPPQGDEPMVIEPYVDSDLCTSCDECTNISKKIFAYNEHKQSYVKDPRGGTFQQLVRAAELCPVKAIHPGTPLNPKEKDLDKWIARAAAFN
jgi:pyruvate-ferredoxin/flavodoxin oxidoreductase